jgi:hypothetical protein
MSLIACSWKTPTQSADDAGTFIAWRPKVSGVTMGRARIALAKTSAQDARSENLRSMEKHSIMACPGWDVHRADASCLQRQ